MVTIGVSEANPYTDTLRQLHATDGMVSVLGNHDMLIYTHLSAQRRLAEVEHLADYERTQLGWHLLRNEHLTIERNGQHINIIGVDLRSRLAGMSRTDIPCTSIRVSVVPSPVRLNCPSEITVITLQ